MSLDRVQAVFDRYSFPRVSGDEPTSFACDDETMAFSPRERG